MQQDWRAWSTWHNQEGVKVTSAAAGKSLHPAAAADSTHIHTAALSSPEQVRKPAAPALCTGTGPVTAAGTAQCVFVCVSE